MERLFGQQVFEVGDESFRWEDVVAYGVLTGRLNSVEHRTRQGLACEAYVDARDDTDEALEEAVDEAAAEFRYERDLVTAEEAEAWLADRELSADEWLGVVRRGVLREAFAAQLDAIVRAYPPDPTAVLESIRIEWLCGGENALADGLAEWAAAAAAQDEVGEAPAEDEEDFPEDEDFPEELEFPSEEPETETETATGSIVEPVAEDLSSYEGRLPGVPRPEVQAIVERLHRLRAGHALFSVSAASPAGIRKELDMHRLDWVRIDGRALFFEEEAAAREGALCVRDDGMSFDELAADAAGVVHEVRFFLTEVEEEVRPNLLGARAREVVGPMRFDERWALLLVLDKILPTEQDETLRQLAIESAVRRAVTTQVTHRVRWRQA